MKIIDSSVLIKINQEIIEHISTDKRFYCKVECFQVENEDIEPNRSIERTSSIFGQSPESFHFNTVYNHTAYANSKHFPQLKAGLSYSFPDFDFSSSCPWHYKLCNSIEQVNLDLGWILTNYLYDSEKILNNLWKTIDFEISLSNSDIYKYEPDGPDAFSESGVILNMTHLFLNEKNSKVLIVHIRESSDNDQMSDSDNENLFESRYGFGVF